MVVTDTCAVMRKCWAIVQDEFPWISAAPCQMHCPSLLINDIAKLPVPALYHYTASFTRSYTEKSIFSILTVKHTV